MNSNREYSQSNNRYIHTDAHQNSLDYGQLNESHNVLIEKKNTKNEKNKFININESYPNISLISIDNNPLLGGSFRILEGTY